MKIYIETNGCAVQRHETYKIANFFIANGWEEIESPEQADMIVMTTCGVVKWTEENALSAIKRLSTLKKKGAPLVVSGCLPSINSDSINNIDHNIIQIDTKEMERFNELINAKVPYETIDYNANPNRHHSLGDPEVHVEQNEIDDIKLINMFPEHKRVLDESFRYTTKGQHLWREPDLFEIRVSYGCASNCSYCITKKAIGNFKSVPKERIISQFYSGLSQGYKKFMLMGDEIGFYGIDTNDSLKALIDAIYDIPGDFRVGIRYIHPDMLVREYEGLEKYFANGFIFYFCTAFQSGSPKILKAMNRNPDITPLINILREMDNKRFPVYKHTQVIVGFPGESEQDFLRTFQVLNCCGFDYVTVTQFSPREGTVAATLEDQVSDEVKAKRYKQILDWMNINRSARLYRRLKQELLK